ncbi:PAS domain S-box protein [Flammeovirga yaeyamensis]|uniref:histidine kinase n=1 Tax=Flammeovirga yaeyamensis TaxID=367791 RepID=A0AAX1N978_9BACT|nr:ATP-binding protein [Flammeovirga yaeyamensis]MBB3697558.1 PAS domain S-box-containing protein [Flammeovirga yaeyamensis]NMF36252.1 PAS domain S-box protein [Flammeovirga yaeyamensis]QWG02981.1 PAS domain S-box protein [Flammeovirga yaeyamensis]
MMNPTAITQLLNDKNQIYHQLYDSSPDMYVSVDPNTGKVLMCNITLTEKVGKCKDQIIGASIMEMYHPDSIEAAKKVFQKFIKGQKIENERLDLITNDGKKIPVLLNVQSIKDECGKIILSNSCWRDISDIVALEKIVKKNDEAIQSKNKELEEFVYIASHDLQEPLRTISSFIELLDMEYGEQLDEEAKTYLEFIEKGSQNMKNIIKGLLDYSRIGNGVERSNIDCNKLIADITSDYHLLFEEKNVELFTSFLPKVYGDPISLRLLFQNLINNAVKFSKKSKQPIIEINYSINEKDVLFSIKDNGIGIPKDKTSEIFKFFKRLNSKSQYDGYGIGLAHCKKIIDLHEGKIWVESILHEGSIFYFTLPKHRTDETNITN